MIRIVIVDDHPLIVQALVGSFALEDDIEVIDTFSDGADLLSRLTHLSPDVLLLDLKVPNLDPLSLVASLREESPSTKVAIITAANDPVLLRRLLDAGATGIQLKTDGQDPAEMVRAVHRGSLYLSAEAAQLTHGSVTPQVGLSLRNRTLLDYLTKGLTNEEIADAMMLSNGTVGNYISQLYRELGVTNRASAVSWWSQTREQYIPE